MCCSKLLAYSAPTVTSVDYGYFGVLNGSNELTKYLLVRKYMQKIPFFFRAELTDSNFKWTYLDEFIYWTTCTYIDSGPGYQENFRIIHGILCNQGRISMGDALQSTYIGWQNCKSSLQEISIRAEKKISSNQTFTLFCTHCWQKTGGYLLHIIRIWSFTMYLVQLKLEWYMQSRLEWPRGTHQGTHLKKHIG